MIQQANHNTKATNYKTVWSILLTKRRSNSSSSNSQESSMPLPLSLISGLLLLQTSEQHQTEEYEEEETSFLVCLPEILSGKKRLHFLFWGSSVHWINVCEFSHFHEKLWGGNDIAKPWRSQYRIFWYIVTTAC